MKKGVAPSSAGDARLLVQLLKLATIITRPMQRQVAAPNDVSINELKVLICLSGEGAKSGSDIAAIISMAPMNVSRALAGLAQRGWVEQVAAAANRRRRPMQLSAAGWKAYEAMQGDLHAVAERLFKALNKSERAALAAAFARMIAAIEGWEPEAPKAAPRGGRAAPAKGRKRDE